MAKKYYKNLRLKNFEEKEEKDTDQKDKPKKKTPLSNSIDPDDFYRNHRHIS